MRLFTFLILVFFTMQIYKDFKRDKGEFKKAKTYHFICLFVLIGVYSGSYSYLGYTIREFEQVQIIYGVDVGIVPGGLHLFLYFLHLFVVLAVLLFSYQMIWRKEKARRRLFYFLPVLALTETFNFYRGWLGDGEEQEFSDLAILLIGFAIFGTFSIVLLSIYNRQFMKDFFASDPPRTTEIAWEARQAKAKEEQADD